MRHHEFWNPRIFELPYYAYLVIGGLVRGLSVKSLAKANYALDHGEIGIGSKFDTQMAFEQSLFLPTARIDAGLSDAEKQRVVTDFAAEHGFPLILKSDIGSVGKGVVRLSDAADVPVRIAQLAGSYLVQKFTPFNEEYGVFYVRHGGRPLITGINRKHFPTIVGNARSTVRQLADAHPRCTPHWATFLQYLDVQRVPAAGEVVQLSFIGSHTMGCKFTDDSELKTPALAQAVFSIFQDQPGFNFGRLDLKAESQQAFQRGEFHVIEVNGVASLPTHMFDPEKTLLQAYRIFLEHGKYLLDAASEHRNQTMVLHSYKEIVSKVRRNTAILNMSHKRLMDV